VLGRRLGQEGIGKLGDLLVIQTLITENWNCDFDALEGYQKLDDFVLLATAGRVPSKRQPKDVLQRKSCFRWLI
jgi:hypothetical protein